MKHRTMIAGTWGALVLFSVGNRFQLDLDTGLRPSEEGVRREQVTYWLGGMMGPAETELWSRCAYGVARIETSVSPENALATALTAALYSPRTVAVTCAAGPEDPPSAPPATRPVAALDTLVTAVLEPWTGYSDRGLAWWLGDDSEVAGDGAAIQSVLIRNREALLNGWVEAVTTHADDGGLVLRFQDNLNYYLLAIRDDAAPWPRGEENLKIYKRMNGDFLELWSTDVDWSRGDARRVRFEADGDRLSVFLDGALIASVVDERPFGAGGFGVRHYGASREWMSRFNTFSWGGR